MYKWIPTRINIFVPDIVTWSFQGETSNGHTALKAATYSAQELSYHDNLLPTILSHIWLCSMDFMGFLHFCR